MLYPGNLSQHLQRLWTLSSIFVCTNYSAHATLWDIYSCFTLSSTTSNLQIASLTSSYSIFCVPCVFNRNCWATRRCRSAVNIGFKCVHSIHDITSFNRETRLHLACCCSFHPIFFSCTSLVCIKTHGGKYRYLPAPGFTTARKTNAWKWLFWSWYIINKTDFMPDLMKLLSVDCLWVMLSTCQQVS